MKKTGESNIVRVVDHGLDGNIEDMMRVVEGWDCQVRSLRCRLIMFGSFKTSFSWIVLINSSNPLLTLFPNIS